MERVAQWCLEHSAACAPKAITSSAQNAVLERLGVGSGWPELEAAGLDLGVLTCGWFLPVIQHEQWPQACLQGRLVPAISDPVEGRAWAG